MSTTNGAKASPRSGGRSPKPTRARRNATPKFNTDPRLEKVRVGLSQDERAMLQERMQVEGCCRVTVWKGHGTVLDGHEALELNAALGLPLEEDEIELPDRQSAWNWIIYNQLGRANLTKEAESYLRGQLYNAHKQSHGGDRRSAQSSRNGCDLKTCEEIAARYKVAPRTIHNDGRLAEALDSLKEKGDDCTDVVRAILTGEVHLSRKEVQELAEMPPADLQKVVPRVLMSGRMPRHQSPESKPVLITVPKEPTALARELLKRYGQAYAAEVGQALARVLEEHRPGSTQEWVAAEATGVRPVTPVDDDGTVRPNRAEVPDAAGGVMTTINTTAT